MHNIKCDMLCHMSHSTIPYHITYHSIITTLDCIPICKRERTHTHTNALSLKTIWIIEHSIRLWRDDDEMFLSLSMCVFNGDTKFLRRFCWFAHFSNQSMLTNSFIFINAQYQFLDFYQFSHRPHHNIPTYQYTAYTMRIHTRHHNTNLSRLSYRMTEYTNSRINAKQVHIFEQPEIKMIKLW